MAVAYSGIMKEVRVLLVDRNKEISTGIVDLLKSYNYKVITVGTCSDAKSMLSKENDNIDVLIISVHSPNLNSFKLLIQAATLDIVSLFVCDEHNELLAKKALKEGAYLFLKKPLGEEIVKYLWQFVLRKKIHREKARKGSEKNEDQMDVDENNIVEDNEKQFGEKHNVHNTEELKNNAHEAENNIVPHRRYKPRRKRKNTNEFSAGKKQINAINKPVRKKNFVEWTVDLHAKFVESVQQLGEGRCFPKEILKMMNVPGLTRMQIASHLQKCRLNDWNDSGKRKYSRRSSGQGSLSGSQQKNSIGKYGTMPHLQKNIPN